MKKVTLYSSSRSSTTGRPNPIIQPDRFKSPDLPRESPATQVAGQQVRSSRRNFFARHKRLLWAAAGGLFGLLLVFVYAAIIPSPRQITQEDIRAAVLHTLETNALPSPAEKAYEVIRPSVVRVRGMAPDKVGGEDKEKSVGTGVVIVDKGVILTNLHVVLGAKRVQVVFADGLESEATVTGVRPEHDLAVLQAQNDSRRSGRGHHALHRGSRPGRPGRCRRLSVRHRPFGHGRSRVGFAARISLPRRQARADQSHPVRRRGQSRELRRAAGDHRRRGRRHRHRRF